MEPPIDIEIHKIVNDRGRVKGPWGSATDGCPALVLDRSGLDIITDRVWRFIRTENPWVGDSHSVYYQTFQVQVQAWKVGEVFLKTLKSLASPENESSAVHYGELGAYRVLYWIESVSQEELKLR
ncbi:hypothetical protein PIB30_058495, partial [Stylosanthes scabra]|nr:hypothetical protein [Stylosanthes scabra]